MQCMAHWLPSSASLAVLHLLTNTVRTVHLPAFLPALLYGTPNGNQGNSYATRVFTPPEPRSTNNKPPPSNLPNGARKQRWKDPAAYGFDRYWRCNKCHCLSRNDEGFFTDHIEACREWDKEHKRAKPRTNEVFPPHWEFAIEQFPLNTPKPGQNYVHDKPPRDVPLWDRASEGEE
jgi:hypothetical protein